MNIKIIVNVEVEGAGCFSRVIISSHICTWGSPLIKFAGRQIK